MSRKRWNVAVPDRESARMLAEECGIDSLVALILNSRGFGDPFEAEEFLDTEQPLCDPMCFADMEAAAARVNAAIADGERICVYGDHDADGVTSTALLYSYLCGRGADVIYMIPEREDGYGLNNDAVRAIKDRGVSLIVTVDNGISAAEEIAFASSLGIDTVVTDHHIPPERLPDCCAVVDPHRADCPSEFKDLAGAGVAFMLVCAMENRPCEDMLPRFGALACIGTVADIMPLNGDNRILLRKGLGYAMTSNIGIAALARCAGVKGEEISAGQISFGLAPRLNAAGRMGKCERAVRLLLEDDRFEAERLAGELSGDNAERQKLEHSILAEAEAQIKQGKMEHDRIIVVSGKGWRSGVVGIVAARIAERYGRPAVVLSEEDGTATGSARSVADFSIYDAVCSCGDLLDRFGGHRFAAGMSMPEKSVGEFRRRINQYAAELSEEMPFPELRIDCKLSPSAFSPEMAESIEALAPFGSGNPTPVFGLFNMRLDRITPIGGGNHIRLELSRGGVSVQVLKFGCTPEEFMFRTGEVLDLAVTVQAGEWNGCPQVTIMLKDARLSGADDEKTLGDIRRFERIMRGEAADASDSLLTRDDVAAVYRAARRFSGALRSVDALVAASGLSGHYLRARLALQTLCELNLVGLETDENGIKIKIFESDVKAELNASPIFRKYSSERSE